MRYLSCRMGAVSDPALGRGDEEKTHLVERRAELGVMLGSEMLLDELEGAEELVALLAAELAFLLLLHVRRAKLVQLPVKARRTISRSFSAEERGKAHSS